METKEFVQKQSRLDQLVREKDNYMAEFRTQSIALTGEIEEHLADVKVQAQIEAMSPDERKAMRDGLQENG